MISRCESPERFYRPDLPEKLCAIGIIDVDDTTFRHISFEKSFQSEYPGELNDSLSDFSFTISSDTKELLNYYSTTSITGPTVFKIPDNVEFGTNEKYYLTARENSTSPISAITIVPQSPSKPLVVSVSRENIESGYLACYENSLHKLANIEFSFVNDPAQNLYYAIYTEHIVTPLWGGDSVHIEAQQFEVIESNTTGFFARLVGFTQKQYRCIENAGGEIEMPLLPYFIEGSKIQGNKCLIKISSLFLDAPFLSKQRWRLKIKVLSIPKDLFLFEKSLFTHYKNSSDPFSEPIYLNGNIKDGNGVFAVCRSTEIIINLSPPY